MVRQERAQRFLQHLVTGAALLTTTIMEGRPAEWITGGGVIGIFDAEPRALSYVQLRLNHEWRGLRPWLEMDAIEGGARWLGAGIAFDAEWRDAHRLTLGVAAGYFDDGGALFLGSSLVFLSTLELSTDLRPLGRVGVSVGHLSNGSRHEFNPGAEFVRVSLSWPLGRW